jgi:hypothetical protein
MWKSPACSLHPKNRFVLEGKLYFETYFDCRRTVLNTILEEINNYLTEWANTSIAHEIAVNVWEKMKINKEK